MEIDESAQPVQMCAQAGKPVTSVAKKGWFADGLGQENITGAGKKTKGQEWEQRQRQGQQIRYRNSVVRVS